jgi:hypothetical protein
LRYGIIKEIIKNYKFNKDWGGTFLEL